jgi:cell division protein FtsL
VTPDGRKRPRGLARVLTFLAATAACAGLFGIVCTHVMLTQGQADLDNLETQATEAQAAHQKLQVEVAELESPQRIVTEARERLGMVTPETVVYLKPGAPRVAAPTTTTVAPTGSTTTVKPRSSTASGTTAAASTESDTAGP